MKSPQSFGIMVFDDAAASLSPSGRNAFVLHQDPSLFTSGNGFSRQKSFRLFRAHIMRLYTRFPETERSRMVGKCVFSAYFSQMESDAQCPDPLQIRKFINGGKCVPELMSGFGQSRKRFSKNNAVIFGRYRNRPVCGQKAFCVSRLAEKRGKLSFSLNPVRVAGIHTVRCADTGQFKFFRNEFWKLSDKPSHIFFIFSRIVCAGGINQPSSRTDKLCGGAQDLTLSVRTSVCLFRGPFLLRNRVRQPLRRQSLQAIYLPAVPALHRLPRYAAVPFFLYFC